MKHYIGCIHVKHVALAIGIIAILGGTFGFMHAIPRHRGDQTTIISMLVVFSTWILCGGLTIWGVVLEKPKMLIPLATCQFIHFFFDNARIGVFLGRLLSPSSRRFQNNKYQGTTSVVQCVTELALCIIPLLIDLLSVFILYHAYWYLKEKKTTQNSRLFYVQYSPFNPSNILRRPPCDVEAGPAEEDAPPDYESCVAKETVH
uniref:Uncharacterized protein n=1 Tax=Steinernema glaseri TaxID=37863 RepID=A0A1I7Z519_9BILA